jgi:hypothetical protein
MRNLREILAAEGLIPQGKTAYDQMLGRISNSSMDNHYGDEMILYLRGGKVDIIVKEWAQIGGMDSLHGAGPREEVARKTVKAEPRALVAAIKALMKAQKAHYLNSAKPSTFHWYLPWSSKGIKGLSLKTAAAALDGWSMSKDVWEATHLAPPKAKPTGGPFTFDRTTKMKDIKAQFAAAGYLLERHPRAVPSSSWGSDRAGAVLLKNGRAWSKVTKLMEASANSMKKWRDDQGWDMYTFDFGGKKITMGKIYYGYPVNGNRWSLWES